MLIALIMLTIGITGAMMLRNILWDSGYYKVATAIISFYIVALVVVTALTVSV